MFKLRVVAGIVFCLYAISNESQANYKASTALEQLRMDTYLMLKHASDSLHADIKGKDYGELFDGIERTPDKTIAVEAAYRVLDLVAYGKQDAASADDLHQRLVPKVNWGIRDATPAERDAGVLNFMGQSIVIAVYTLFNDMFDVGELARQQHREKYKNIFTTDNHKSAKKTLEKLVENAGIDAMKKHSKPFHDAFDKLESLVEKAKKRHAHRKMVMDIWDLAALEYTYKVKGFKKEDNPEEEKKYVAAMKQIEAAELDLYDFSIINYVIAEGKTLDKFNPKSSVNSLVVPKETTRYTYDEYAKFAKHLQEELWAPEEGSENFIMLPVVEPNSNLQEFLEIHKRRSGMRGLRKSLKHSKERPVLKLGMVPKEKLDEHVKNLLQSKSEPRLYVNYNKGALVYSYVSDVFGTESVSNREIRLRYPRSSVKLRRRSSKSTKYADLLVHCNTISGTVDLKHLKTNKIVINAKKLGKNVSFAPAHNSIKDLEINLASTDELDNDKVLFLMYDILQAYHSSTASIFDRHDNATITINATGIGALLPEDNIEKLSKSKLKPSIEKGADQIKMTLDKTKYMEALDKAK